ncbi:hypothetical protein K431DRAFT_280177 [Polychaeton citri CBS 116435]|uniref:DNA-binding protein RAP1 n=1 Tax=Polychaeton citri CBS 116435 TaxID=1314669 RepID=A0A9P4QH27_9PEZI|nr:hypothetical protein K431DRAFT_280177 [Polychaeton citri CBS 116435]
MASAPVVITPTSGSIPSKAGLFAGLKFFVTQRTPTRNHYISLIESNGGRMVRLERYADHVIADHLKPDYCPNNSLSYTFVDVAVREGRLPSAADHLAGKPAAFIRDVGSSVPTKGTRTAFTKEDDQVLWQWVEKRKSEGERVKGNKIYVELERQNQRHTFQAWRDRYLKKFMVKHQVITDQKPTTEHVIQELNPAQPPVSMPTPTPSPDIPPQPVNAYGFTDSETHKLIEEMEDILDVSESREDEAWDAWAEAFPTHSAQEWKKYCEEVALPAYERGKVHGLLLVEGGSDDRLGQGDMIDEPEVHNTPVTNALARNLDGSGAATQALSLEGSIQSEHSKDKRKRENTLQGSTQATISQKRRKIAVNSPPRLHRPQPCNPTKLERNPDVVVLAEQFGEEEGEAEGSNEDLFRKELQRTVAAGMGFLKSSQSLVEQPSEQRSDAPSVEDLDKTFKPGPYSALTAANLSKQQAQHKAQLLRGVDLPVDGESQDQTDYVRYLQSLQDIQVNDTSKLLDSDRKTRFLDSHGDVQSDTSSASPGEGADDDGGLPPDSVTSDLLELPQPHKVSKTEPDTEPAHPESHRLETQTQQPSFFNEAMENAELSSQPFSSQLHEPQYNQVRKLFQRQDLQTEDDMDSSDMDASTPELDDGQIDLTIPEPEGGFQLSSPSHPRQNKDALRDNGSSTTSRHSNAAYDASLSQSPSPSLPDDPMQDNDLTPRPMKCLRAGMDTQAFLDVETQKPDFHMPLPSDLDADDSSKILPQNSSKEVAYQMPTSPRRSTHKSVQDPFPHNQHIENMEQTHGGEERPGLNAMNDWIESMMGLKHKEATIIWALKRCSMRPELAELVLHYHKKGKGLPLDVPGIWSEEEDLILQGHDAKGLSWLEEKHGGSVGGWDEMNDRMEFLDQLNEYD